MKKYITTILAVLLMLTSAHALTSDNANQNTIDIGNTPKPIIESVGDGSRPNQENQPETARSKNKKGGGNKCIRHEWSNINGQPTPVCILKAEGRTGFWDLHSFLRA